MREPHTIGVALGARSYDIHLGAGLLGQAGMLLQTLQSRGRAFIITDETVHKLHGAALVRALEAAGRTVMMLTVPAGEASKNLAVYADLMEQITRADLERQDMIIGFGGGVVGDLTGFVAATALRGIDFVQIPTSLLAQVDSSVGGKTGVNLSTGKNLVGAFYQPKLVLIDTQLLATLDARQLRAGYAEIVKMALLGDASFFDLLETKKIILSEAGEDRDTAIATACRMKAQIVARDETEQGERMLLNLGHTFGHALEALSGYGDALLHGEAVAIGLALAFRFAALRGDIEMPLAARVSAHLQAMGLPTTISERFSILPRAQQILALMARDKKNKDGAVRLVLPTRIGAAHVVTADKAMLHTFLTTELETHP